MWVQEVVDEVYVPSCLQDMPAYLHCYLTIYTGKILLPLCWGWGGVGWGYRKLLMKFMSHPVSKIRQHTYTAILQSIQAKYYYLFAGGGVGWDGGTGSC